jgi:hypothetical protein
MLLLVKQPLEEFRRLCRLGLPTVESPAGYWGSWPFAEAGLSGLSRGDSRDVSRQMALPLAYPSSHPHDTSPQNWRSLMG